MASLEDGGMKPSDVDIIVPPADGKDPSQPAAGLSSPFWRLPVIHGWTRREVLLSAAAVLALVLVLILTIVSATIGSSMSSQPLLADICTDTNCLEAASNMLQNMNKSVEPCDDFYTYSCGGWIKSHPIIPWEVEGRSVFSDIREKNEEKLRLLLEAPVQRDTPASFERKLKHFFMSCLDDYGQEKQKGDPLLAVLHQLGGWYVINTWDEASWNMNTAVRKVQLDFWISTFFSISTTVDTMDRSRNMIRIDRSGLIFNPNVYIRTNQPVYARAMTSYRTLLDAISRLLVRDAGQEPNDAKILTFVNDVTQFETELANRYVNSQGPSSNNPLDNRISIRDLQIRAGAINWRDLFSYVVTDPATPITDDTEVLLYYQDYIVQVSNYILSLQTNNDLRIFYNYMLWRLMLVYHQHLSWDYIHAYREFYVAVTGRQEFLGTWLYCFRFTDANMGWALGSLFIRDHFADDNKAKVEELAIRIKLKAIDELSQATWMDQDTRDAAKAKILSIKDSLGYPLDLLDDSGLDDYYMGLTVNYTDHFANVINAAAFQKTFFGRRLAKKTHLYEWDVKTYSTFGNYLYAYNELVFPAGILQFPIFDAEHPQYMNYAAAGTIIGREVINAIDDVGGYYGIDGAANDWWSPDTRSNYAERKACVSDYYSNMTVKAYPEIDPYPVQGARIATSAIAETHGLRLAYMAYKDWEGEYGQEKLPLGVHGSSDQAFFLSYAQMYCAANTYIGRWRQTVAFGSAPEDVRVFGVLQQTREFTQAFQCSLNDNMNREDRCQVF
ncbi:endothelin-converting enzyme homolog [Branchiostoma floridae]|uniref:Endothelin-converting enzyme homolog n=1 Tax=Branchiostoma floridae TaxID=7739 RepID=A0A9J7KG83_BRAFL|nr:endothelin-converting enzyme homolog [Branchiostoma floridae]XP_035658644.1 endothelin-converting enzyme homolog [Branchiostoma floridae]